MSFGNSLRFESNAPGQGSKPMIFWQQQNKDAESRNLRKQKKFGPTDKGLKYPIRGQKKPSGDDPIPLSPEPDDDLPPRPGRTSHPPAGGQNRPIRTQQTNKTKPPPGNRDNRNTVGNKNTSKPNNAKKKPVLTGKGKKGKDKEPGDIDNGTVTLTKDQLNSILETIGVLTLEKEELEKQNNALGKSKEDLSFPAPQATSEKIENVNSSIDLPTNEQETAATDNKENHNRHIQNNLPQESNPNQTRKNDNVLTSPRETEVKKPPLAGIPSAHLTKAEKKRLQWERERAEQKEVYEPWGRPGAGAPLRDTSGNILADFNTRKEDGGVTDQKAEVQKENNQDSQKQAWKNDNQTQNTSHNNHVEALSRLDASRNFIQQQESVPQTIPSHVPGLSLGNDAPEPSQPHASMPHAPNLPNHTNQMVSQPQVSNFHPTSQERVDGKTPPAAMRSSFTIGRIAPDENKYATTKEQQNKEWLADLQKQIEEKKLAKEREKEKERQVDTWADRMSNYKPSQLPVQNQPRQTVDDMHATNYNQSSNVPNHGGPRVNSAPKETADPLGESQSSTYIRGQNVFIDPTTRRELEEKRKKNMEYQEQLRLQLEERDKQKRLERERRIQEELEEERKFAAQRATFERKADLEQQKAKQKELEKQRQVDALKEAMERAAEAAEKEKHEKRMRRLQQGGHDVGGLQTTYEASKTPRTVTHVEPSYVPGLHPTPRDTHRDSHRDTHREGAQSSYPEPLPLDAYTEDRVLTPTAYRAPSVPGHDPLSPRREFGVQTDFMEETRLQREESTDIVYNGPVKSEKNKNKKVRVKSATLTKTKTLTKEEPEEKTTGKLKPWGAQNNKDKKKKPVKNSERDPYHEIRKKKREQLRLQRQAQLREETERNAPRVAQATTAASRARSRSEERVPSKKQSSHTRQRSRSPPAVNGYRDNERKSRADVGRIDSRTPHQTTSHYDHSKYSQRSVSPPIPTLKHRTDHDVNLDLSQFEHHHYDQYARPQISSRLAQSNTARTIDTRRQKYTDTGPVNAPVNNGEFVPFIRSMNVLDPAHADSPLPPSREASAVERARKAYVEGHQPGNFGTRMENREDKPIGRDPLINPSLVTDVPTSRQGQILQHLSDLRRGLMQKRREVEVGLPVDPENEADQGAE